MPPGGGGDGDLALDDADLHGADPGQERAVVKPAKDRRLARGREPGQEGGTGAIHGLKEGVGGESPVQQHDHARMQGAQQAASEDGFARLAGAEDRVDDRAGAAGHQGDQQDLRVAGGGGVLIGSFAQPSPHVRVVWHVQVRAVDGDDQQSGPAGAGGADRTGRTAEQVEQGLQRAHAQPAPGVSQSGRGDLR
ncbi:hypothetical protein GCM10009575_092430 [Streptomyces rhizosphaericus]|uniref:Uncharacterized protein n=1 Tax=Streptomyces rhizosphaericus TaxID=114699 RepID=A0ABN1RLU1_9ACTN